ncbi:MAG: hypothetical protein AAGH60_11855 [Pseudomonadota bacterium]
MEEKNDTFSGRIAFGAIVSVFTVILYFCGYIDTYFYFDEFDINISVVRPTLYDTLVTGFMLSFQTFTFHLRNINVNFVSNTGLIIFASTVVIAVYKLIYAAKKPTTLTVYWKTIWPRLIYCGIIMLYILAVAILILLLYTAIFVAPQSGSDRARMNFSNLPEVEITLTREFGSNGDRQDPLSDPANDPYYITANSHFLFVVLKHRGTGSWYATQLPLRVIDAIHVHRQ